MHQLPRNMLPYSQILFKCTKTAVQNIGGTPSYLFLERTNEKDCQTSEFSCRLFNHEYEFSTVKPYAKNFLRNC